jgi:hypothetical protein
MMLTTCWFPHLLCVVALVDDLLDRHILTFKQAPAAVAASTVKHETEDKQYSPALKDMRRCSYAVCRRVKLLV